MSIIFENHPDYKFTHRRGLPTCFYRTFHEASQTPSRYTFHHHDIDHDIDHDEALPGAAFQALGTFDKEFEFTEHLARDAILRHLNPSYSSEPYSSYISVYDSKSLALTHAHQQSHHANPTLRRTCISIAQIKTSDRHTRLVPAAYRIKPSFLIPIWVDRRIEAPNDNNDNEAETSIQWKDIHHYADTWIALSEIRSMLNVPDSDAHDNEWLACGKISARRIDRIMPYDGETLHTRQPTHPVTSHSQEYEFYWTDHVWITREDADATRLYEHRLLARNRAAMIFLAASVKNDLLVQRDVMERYARALGEAGFPDGSLVTEVQELRGVIEGVRDESSRCAEICAQIVRYFGDCGGDGGEVMDGVEDEMEGLGVD